MDVFNSNLDIILFSVFAVLPGLVWLLVFLREDAHPEPPGMILRVFLFGSLFALPVAVLFGVAECFLELFTSSLFLINIVVIIVLAPFIEELVKYLAVRLTALKHPECDEPVDFMIYAVTAALGFATVENIIFLLPVGSFFYLEELMTGSFIRFIGATLLHAITSGIMGYFLAVSVLRRKKRFIFIGLFVAVLLHASYNFFILLDVVNTFIPLVLTTFFLILLFCFKRLRNTDFC